MAKAKLSRRAKDLREGDEHIIQDHDPEANGGDDAPQGSGDESSEDENAGTEHYVTVGKSKLREKEGVSLGPQYRGSRVSRNALGNESDSELEEDEEDEDEDESEDYADPDMVDLEADEAEASDSEIDSDNALAESDADRLNGFVFRGSSKPGKAAGKAKKGKRATAADFMSSDEGEQGGADVDDSGEDEDMDDGLDDLVNGAADSEEDDSDDDSEDGDEEDEDEDESEEDDEDGQAAKEQSAKPMMGALSNNADVVKGVAIQRQRKAYDGLLNLRIRMQKALVAVNTLPTLDESLDDEPEAYEAAEEAAVKLLNTISSLQDHFAPSARAGDKRKRGSLDTSMSSEEIWAQLQREDDTASKSRNERLEKWSRKVQSVNVSAPRGLGARNKTLVGAMQEQLEDPENRLVKRTRVPRSCAPAQAAGKTAGEGGIYDDADFYQVLLKELVDQRTVESESTGAAGAVPSVMLTAASKEAKGRKSVDRKASKGRKMRFTVHEKLQNFMAPEDRRAWEQGAIDRFFGALFGRKLELNEDEDEDESDGVDVEEEGLRLFRS